MEYEGIRRTRSKVEVFFHFVWATKGRRAALNPDWERVVHRCVTQQVEKLGCAVLALDGAADHVHLVVRASAMACPAQIAKQTKGASSALLNDIREEFSEPFDWQDGYGCFSISRPHVATIIAYVKNQKRHHSTGNVWPEWEEANEPV